ncbi:hypothetical protein COX84_07285, partial [Candidatus Micrarchaeota archaeon CG_4_10_14_0_2_um_filter_49_7]
AIRTTEGKIRVYKGVGLYKPVHKDGIVAAYDTVHSYGLFAMKHDGALLRGGRQIKESIRNIRNAWQRLRRDRNQVFGEAFEHFGESRQSSPDDFFPCAVESYSVPYIPVVLEERTKRALELLLAGTVQNPVWRGEDANYRVQGEGDLEVGALYWVPTKAFLRWQGSHATSLQIMSYEIPTQWRLHQLRRLGSRLGIFFDQHDLAQWQGEFGYYGLQLESNRGSLIVKDDEGRAIPLEEAKGMVLKGLAVRLATFIMAMERAGYLFDSIQGSPFDKRGSNSSLTHIDDLDELYPAYDLVYHGIIFGFECNIMDVVYYLDSVGRRLGLSSRLIESEGIKPFTELVYTYLAHNKQFPQESFIRSIASMTYNLCNHLVIQGYFGQIFVLVKQYIILLSYERNLRKQPGLIRKVSARTQNSRAGNVTTHNFTIATQLLLFLALGLTFHFKEAGVIWRSTWAGYKVALYKVASQSGIRGSPKGLFIRVLFSRHAYLVISAFFYSIAHSPFDHHRLPFAKLQKESVSRRILSQNDDASLLANQVRIHELAHEELSRLGIENRLRSE